MVYVYVSAVILLPSSVQYDSSENVRQYMQVQTEVTGNYNALLQCSLTIIALYILPSK